MQRALSVGHLAFEDADFPVALEAERDLQVLGFIFRQVDACGRSAAFVGLVKKLLSDSTLPQDDERKETPGRDAQFELYLAAICQCAGLLPVDYTEPDVSCMVGDTSFGIAAKRIKSFAQVKSHVKKAAEQIAHAKKPGIIAIDISMAWNPGNRPIFSRMQSDLHLMVLQAEGHQFFREREEEMYRWVAGRGVLGVVAFNWHIRLRRNNEWGLDGMTTWFDATHGIRSEQADYDSFREAFLKGVPNLTDLAAV